MKPRYIFLLAVCVQISWAGSSERWVGELPSQYVPTQGQTVSTPADPTENLGQNKLARRAGPLSGTDATSGTMTGAAAITPPESFSRMTIFYGEHTGAASLSLVRPAALERIRAAKRRGYRIIFLFENAATPDYWLENSYRKRTGKLPNDEQMRQEYERVLNQTETSANNRLRGSSQSLAGRTNFSEFVSALEAMVSEMAGDGIDEVRLERQPYEQGRMEDEVERTEVYAANAFAEGKFDLSLKILKQHREMSRAVRRLRDEAFAQQVAALLKNGDAYVIGCRGTDHSLNSDAFLKAGVPLEAFLLRDGLTSPTIEKMGIPDRQRVSPDEKLDARDILKGFMVGPLVTEKKIPMREAHQITNALLGDEAVNEKSMRALSEMFPRLQQTEFRDWCWTVFRWFETLPLTRENRALLTRIGAIPTPVPTPAAPK